MGGRAGSCGRNRLSRDVLLAAAGGNRRSRGAGWAYIGNPRRYPEWAGNVVSVTGLATVEPDAEFQQVSQTPLGKAETTFKIEQLEDLHTIKLRCQQSGYYSRWVLTEAQSCTFAEVEIGIEPTAVQYRLLFGAMGSAICGDSSSKRLTACGQGSNTETDGVVRQAEGLACGVERG